MTNVISITDAYANAEDVSPVWPDPSPLPYVLPPVPAFDPKMLPAHLRPWLEDIADRLSIPLDFTAIPGMVAAGSLIGAKVGVRPQQKTTWTETANLWGLVVARPGALKSPAVTEVLSPIRRLDAKADKAYQSELAYFEDQMTVHKLNKDVVEKRARKSVQDGNLIGAQDIIAEAREPASPVQKRYMLTDATVEKLGMICADNPDGILVYRDEMLTLLSDLDSEEKANARGFFMTGWTGSDFYTFDRVTREQVRIPRVNISLLGTSQPARLAKYMRGSLADKGDGMVQRLQLLTWPDMTSDWREVDRFPDTAAKEAAFGCYESLSLLKPESVGASRDAFDDGSGIPYLRFDPGAIELFRDYRAGLERSIRSDELPSALVEHLSKYRGLIPRLALICHLASGGVGDVTQAAVAMAIDWAGYLAAHAQRAYGSLMIDSGDAARAIWKRIEKGDLVDGFTERDIYSRHWANLAKGPRLTEGLKLLVECDWLSAQTRSTGGRPTTVYAINPKALGSPVLLAA